MLSICVSIYAEHMHKELIPRFPSSKDDISYFSAEFPVKSACLWRPIFLILHLQKYEAGPEVLLPVKEAEMEAMRQPQSPGDRPSFEDYMRYKGIYIYVDCTQWLQLACKKAKQKRIIMFSFPVKRVEH
jgi:hypothetical protein